MRRARVKLSPEVAAAHAKGRPVVALESTLITHGLPRPLNLEAARLAEAAVRQEGAIPATIAVLRGVPTAGLSDAELRELAEGDGIMKASSRDLATALAQKRTAATTVAATMRLACWADIEVFATGGIGGVHRGAEQTWDVSADLTELARTPVAVVCAGAKGILDLPRTLEVLETKSVPVVGYGTDEFPAFYVRSSGLPLTARVDSPEAAAALCRNHWWLFGKGLVLAQPIDAAAGLEPEEFESALAEAEGQAAAKGMRGPALTPFLLARLAEITGGRTLRANQALIVANARLAAQVAVALAAFRPSEPHPGSSGE
jgi:pseudouridine-5'-phosphate glycosidase